MPNDSWNEYSKLVLAELRRLDGDVQKVSEQLNQIQVEIALLKLKSGVWGAAGSMFVVLPTFILWLMNR